MAEVNKRKPSVQLTIDIYNQLFDEKLLERYGTSISVGMGRKYQRYIDKKFETLKKEFEQINKNPNDVLTIDELQTFLEDL